jgi:hypothetical protein
MSLQKIPLSWECRGDDIYTVCSRYSFWPNETQDQLRLPTRSLSWNEDKLIVIECTERC